MYNVTLKKILRVSVISFTLNLLGMEIRYGYGEPHMENENHKVCHKFHHMWNHTENGVENHTIPWYGEPSSLQNTFL